MNHSGWQFFSIDDMWRATIRHLAGMRTIGSRDGQCREAVAFACSVDKPQTIAHSRGMSPIYAAGEFLWYLAGSNEGSFIRHYAPSYSRFLEKDPSGREYANGAYGPRWQEQLAHVVERLRRDPLSRQAVLGTWSLTDIMRYDTADTPCTLSLQFLIRDGALDCVATMRSNDAWLGLPYDAFAFTRLQRLVADDLGVPLGRYHHRAGSMHLYERDVDKAMQCLSSIPHAPVVINRPRVDARVHEAARWATELEHIGRVGATDSPDQLPEWIDGRIRESKWKDAELGAIVALASMRKLGPRRPSGISLRPLVSDDSWFGTGVGK